MALVRLNIDASLFKPDDKEVVEDLIVAAISDGQKKAADMAQTEMGKLTAGMQLPPGMKLPF
jgi:nucleoid-associated protein EbfC